MCKEILTSVWLPWPDLLISFREQGDFYCPATSWGICRVRMGIVRLPEALRRPTIRFFVDLRFFLSSES